MNSKSISISFGHVEPRAGKALIGPYFGRLNCPHVRLRLLTNVEIVARCKLSICVGGQPSGSTHFGETCMNPEIEVVYFPSQYHVILGSTSYSRFMAASHHTYLLLKMPGPNGVITIKGNFVRSDACDSDEARFCYLRNELNIVDSRSLT
jgi:hypothetical protein